jgi:hypothetical protein
LMYVTTHSTIYMHISMDKLRNWYIWSNCKDLILCQMFTGESIRICSIQWNI